MQVIIIIHDQTWKCIYLTTNVVNICRLSIIVFDKKVVPLVTHWASLGDWGGCLAGEGAMGDQDTNSGRRDLWSVPQTGEERTNQAPFWSIGNFNLISGGNNGISVWFLQNTKSFQQTCIHWFIHIWAKLKTISRLLKVFLSIKYFFVYYVIKM